jgi:hypothetical protein
VDFLEQRVHLALLVSLALMVCLAERVTKVTGERAVKPDPPDFREDQVLPELQVLLGRKEIKVR